MLYRIVYSSQANGKMPKSKLYQILRQARLMNGSRNITGVLAFVENTFFQVLEGEEGIVRELLQKIAADGRHTNFRVICEERLAGRTFSSWKMAYVSASAKELAEWAGLRSTVTIEETLTHLRSAPGNVPDVLVRLLEAIPARQEAAERRSALKPGV